MERYRASGPADDPSIIEGDVAFIGVNQYDVPENLAPAICQNAVNMDFTKADAMTRGGFVCLPQASEIPFGQTWTSRTPASSNNWKSVAYGNNIFAAVASSGAGNRVMTSPDGVTWTSRMSAADVNWSDITWGNNLFVAVSSTGSANGVMTSPDGVTWTQRTAPAHNWQGVTYGAGLYVAVGGSVAMTSPDGITWTDQTQATNFIRSVAYGNSLFVAVSAVGEIIASTDGATWTITYPGSSALTDISYGAGLFVALGGAGAVFTSPDGINWTQRNAANANTWFTLAYSPSGFVAVASAGSDPRVMTSQNGIGWVARTGAGTDAWAGVAFGNNVFVAVASNAVMTSNTGVQTVFASGIYSEPEVRGDDGIWIMVVGTTSVGFYAYGRTTRVVQYADGLTVMEQATVVQCNNLVYIFRGFDDTPLYWTGDWGDDFELAPTPTPGAGFSIIPDSNQATYAQDRLWIIKSKDEISASDVLDFNTYDDLANAFRINTGDSDFLVTSYPFGTTTLILFKHRSILALTGIDGSLTDVAVTEITRQVGAIGINTVVSVGPDLVYMSDRNINLLSLTTTNNSIQHKILPLSTPIQKIMARVNWNVAPKVSMAYWDNKLFVALPLDGNTKCNSVVVYNFVTSQWYGEWSFSGGIDIWIQGWVVANYLGAQRLHCVTEDGRIFVTDEGQNDISGTIVSEISTSLTTRAYRADNNNRINRRMWMDLATNRPDFSVDAFSEGVSESTGILTGQTYLRSQSWLFNDAFYALNNSNDDYNRAYRKDYAGYPGDLIQTQSGFTPEALQEYRYPIVTRRTGRLTWFEITNTTGVIAIRGIGYEARAGDRRSFVQV